MPYHERFSRYLDSTTQKQCLLIHEVDQLRIDQLKAVKQECEKELALVGPGKHNYKTTWQEWVRVCQEELEKRSE